MQPFKHSLTTLFASLAILAGSPPSAVGADDPAARAIMERVDARDDGDDQVSRMEMVLIDKSGHQRVREIRSFAKDFGEDTYRLMFFLSPADVKGTGFLTYDYYAAERDDDQWLYLPELGKVKLFRKGPMWGQMALSGGKLVCRDQQKMKCLDVSAAANAELSKAK